VTIPIRQQLLDLGYDQDAMIAPAEWDGHGWLANDGSVAVIDKYGGAPYVDRSSLKAVANQALKYWQIYAAQIQKALDLLNRYPALGPGQIPAGWPVTMFGPPAPDRDKQQDDLERMLVIARRMEERAFGDTQLSEAELTTLLMSGARVKKAATTPEPVAV
jgi:hypothetical protein